MATPQQHRPPERRIRLERQERREFRQIRAAIIFHQEPPDTEARSFICAGCGHCFSICTCPKEATL